LRELSLHILDLVENAIRAGATIVAVSVEEEPDRDFLYLAVEDNGPGLPVPSDPKEGTATGIGLLKLRTEQAGGTFRLERSCLGGLAVRAAMPLSRVDRSPLGDLAATLASVVCTSPGVELRSRLRVGIREWSVSTEDILHGLPVGSRSGIAVAQGMKERIAEGFAVLRG
jgi:hypothetical protein